MQPMWHYLHHRSFTGILQALCLFPTKKLDVFGFKEQVSGSSTRSMPSIPKDAPLFHSLCMEAVRIQPDAG